MTHPCSLKQRHPLPLVLVSDADFLGLLHLEIIQERLEREYNLDLVTTAPGVVYHVYKTNGEMMEVTNPSNLPDPSEIEHMEEPVVDGRDYGYQGICRSRSCSFVPGTPWRVYRNGIHGGNKSSS